MGFRWGWGRVAQQLGQRVVAESAPLPDWPGAGSIQNHFRYHRVERRVEGLASPIHQLQQHAVAAGLPSLEPEGRVLIHQKAVTVHGHPQTPAAIVVPQALEGGIQQQPVEQHWLLARQVHRTHWDQLGASCFGNRQGIGGHPVHPDLVPGPWAFHRFAPGPGRIGGDAVAARGKGRQVDLEARRAGGRGRPGQAYGHLVINLNHHMGPEPQGAGINQGPIAHLQAHGHGAVGQVGAILRRQDRYLGVVLAQR